MKSIFIMINSLGVGGAEKSLVSFINTIDLSQYRVFLQMINRGGAFESFLPHEVTILPELPFVAFCQQSNKQQVMSGNIRFLISRMKLSMSLRRNRKENHILHDTQAYWRGASRAFEQKDEKYDIAIAWGQGTPTHYVSEKIYAKMKLAWINADYEAVGHNPVFDYAIYEKFDYIIGVSERLSEKISRVFPEYKNKIRTIYDINSGKLIHAMSQENVDDLYKPGVVNLCTVGRLVKPKGYDLAINAAEKLVEMGIEFRWIIIGDGPERENIEKDIQDKELQEKVLLIGTKINPYPYMKIADIYVQTSRSEGFCLTLTEARILNKICVSTCFDVVFDQLENEKNGLIVEMTGESIAKGIRKITIDEELAKKINDNLKKENNSNEEEIKKLYSLVEGR